MNPQYITPGQPPLQHNNNIPSNMYPPSSDFNGGQNANIYPPYSNGNQGIPPMDMSQKMQNLNLNGPQAGAIPQNQLPPGQMPPGTFQPTFSGQSPQSQSQPQNRPQAAGAQFPPSSVSSVLPPTTQGPNQMQRPSMSQPQPNIPPPASTPGHLAPSSQAPQQFGHSQQQLPPQQQLLPQSGHLPPQPNQLPPQPGQLPPQPGQLPSQIGQMPPQSRPGTLPPQPNQMPPQSTQMGPPQTQQNQQSGQLPPQSKTLMPPAQGPPSMAQNQLPKSMQPPTSQAMFGGQQPGQMPPQPVQMQPQQSQMPGQPSIAKPPQSMQMPPQPGQLPTQPNQTQAQFPPRSGVPPMPGQPGGFQQPGLSQQPGLPQQPGQMPLQPGQMPQPGQLPPQPRQMPPQSGQLPPQPGQMPSQPSQMPSQPGQMPPQHGQMPTQHGQMPPQHGQMPQPGQVPQSGQMPPTSQPQYASNQGYPQPPGPPMPGLPHMPPPVSQGQRYPGMPPAQPGLQQPVPQQQQYPGMPPMPAQQPSGYPPQGYPAPPQGYTGQQQPYPGQQAQYPGYQQPQQAMKRLDPDQMPSPIQVMSDDQQNRGGVFVTNEKGLVPPLVTTDFVVDDQGNSSPRYIRSSMYSVPVTADLLKQTSVPFCLAISPMAEPVGAEREPPLLDFAALTNSPTMGPVRCSRCKAYMCPAMKFLDAARHFKCPFCKATTEVPMEYTQYVNSMQQYGRVPAEMGLGTYEIVATKEYCRNNTLPNPPALVFLIDVSYNSVRCGLLNVVCDNIKNIVDAIPKDEQTGQTNTRVGFITYSSTIHFYNIKGSLGQPQMMSVGDVTEVFVPLLDGFLVKAEDSGPVLDALLQQIPAMFADNKETEIILLPAIQAGLEALKAADTSGQLLVFHTSLPTFPAPGKLVNRDDRKLLGTDKEKQILGPQNTSYNELGQACSAAGVCVELFLANNSYVDAATIGQVSRLTGGGVNKYTYFQADVDGYRLVQDVIRVVSRPTAYDAVMRVRTSTGVRATDFYGHFFMSNTTDVELAAIDADKSVAVEIKHDDKLTGEDGVYVQAALLYTHRSGQRRLRVLNLALNVAQQLADVYRSCELDTLINYLSKQGVWALREGTPRQVREAMSARCARSLATYRRHCASPSSAGQLVLPESMKLMPLYVSCLLRSDALAGGADITCDERSVAMYRALTADVGACLAAHYPRLLPLHRIQEVGEQESLPPLRASIDKMHDGGVYLLENGVHMLMWVGSQAVSEFIQNVFGVPSPQQIDTQVTELPVLDNPVSEAVRDVIQDARQRRHRCMRLTIMRQHDKLEAVLRHFLVEDRGVDGSASYVDFLCHVHKEIRALL